MSYELPTPAGVVHLLKYQQGWTVQFNGRRGRTWHSPDAAAKAVALHRSGLPEWDRLHSGISPDILDWRPLGESL